MNKRQTEKFRKILLQERSSIIQHLVELKGHSDSSLSVGPGDDADIASTEMTQAALQKIGNRESKYLKKIDYALKKMDDGEYGTCEECGEQIGVPRLEARPIALFCIDCKTMLEQKERQFSEDDEDSGSSWMNSDNDSD